MSTMKTPLEALSTLPPAGSIEARALPHSSINYLFENLQHQLGGKMADLFEGAKLADVKATWAKHLGEMGIQKSELQRGLAATATRKFPPTLGEFAVLCRPALDPEAAWYEAEQGLKDRDAGSKGDWSHPGVWRAAATMAREVQSGDYPRNRGRWAALLKRELARGFYPEVPAVPPRLSMTNAPPKPPTPEMLERLRKLSEEIHASLPVPGVPLSEEELALARDMERANGG